MRLLERVLSALAWNILPAYCVVREYAHAIRWFFVAHYMKRRKEWIGMCGAAAQRAFREIEGDHTVDFNFFTHGPGYSAESKADGTPLFYLEAPLQLVLRTIDGPIAVMALEFRGRALCIRQLQGIAGIPIPAKLKNWPMRFIESCVLAAKCAEEERLEEVRVYKADQTFFYRFPILTLGPNERYEEVLREHQRRMRRRYDGTARQLGFTKKEKWYSLRVSE